MGLRTELSDKLLELYVYVWIRNRRRAAAALVLVGLLATITYAVTVVSTLWSWLTAGLLSIPTIVLIVYVFQLVGITTRLTRTGQRFLGETLPESREKQRIEDRARVDIIEHREYFGFPGDSFEDFEIDWVEEFPADGGHKDVLVVPETGDQHRRTARLVMEWVKKAMLDNRTYIRNDATVGVSCFVSDDILRKSEEEASRTRLKNGVLETELKRKEVATDELSQRYRELEDLHREGFLSSVLVHEYDNIDPSIAEIESLRRHSVKVLQQLAEVADEERDPILRAGQFDVRLMKVSRLVNVSVYHQQLKYAFGRDESEVVYLLAIGKSVPQAIRLREWAEENIGVIDDEKTVSDIYTIINEEYGRSSRFFARLVNPDA